MGHDSQWQPCNVNHAMVLTCKTRDVSQTREPAKRYCTCGHAHTVGVYCISCNF